MNQPREVVADALPELPGHVGTQEVYDPNAFGNTSLMRVYTADQMREYAVRYAAWLATQPGDYLTSNVPNRLVYEAANIAPLFDIAMETLRQIESTPRNAGARRNARATIRFIETQKAE